MKKHLVIWKMFLQRKLMLSKRLLNNMLWEIENSRKELDRAESLDGYELSEDEDSSGNEDFPQHSEKSWDREYSGESDDYLLSNGAFSSKEKQTLQTT
jgi:hypothetical protein